ncbi:DsbA family protein [Sphingomonas sp. DT-204]|uniref:DsbA family protein n=1 Tax=Sphingomonas sp. DT-204 TaxID=3396166 RepID=UPI003F1D7B9E
MTLRPFLLALLLVAAGAVGGAAVLAIQTLRPAPATGDVRGYLLAHPEVIPEAMNALRDRESAKAVAANRGAIVDPFPGAVGGNPNGDVTVVAFMDYACGYCRASLPALAELVKTDPGVRIVYRELPILSPDSRTAAEWSLAAAEQGKFMPFHEALYAAGHVNQASIAAAAAIAGLDRTRASAVARSQPVAAEIAKNLKTAGELGVTGTPSWVIGDRFASGAIGYDALAEAVKAARAKG